MVVVGDVVDVVVDVVIVVGGRVVVGSIVDVEVVDVRVLVAKPVVDEIASVVAVVVVVLVDDELLVLDDEEVRDDMVLELVVGDVNVADGLIVVEAEADVNVRDVVTVVEENVLDNEGGFVAVAVVVLTELLAEVLLDSELVEVRLDVTFAALVDVETTVPLELVEVEERRRLVVRVTMLAVTEVEANVVVAAKLAGLLLVDGNVVEVARLMLVPVREVVPLPEVVSDVTVEDVVFADGRTDVLVVLFRFEDVDEAVVLEIVLLDEVF